MKTHYMNAKEFKKVVNTRFGKHWSTDEIKRHIVKSFSNGFINLDQLENELKSLPYSHFDHLLGDEMPFSIDSLDYSKDKLFKYLTVAYEEVTPYNWTINWLITTYPPSNELFLLVYIGEENKGYKLDAFPYDLVHSEINTKLRQSGWSEVSVFISWSDRLYNARLIVNKNTGQCQCFDTPEKTRDFYNNNVVPLMLEKITQTFPEFVANQQMMTMPSW